MKSLIFIVDDSKTMQYFMKHTLSSEGYEVVSTKNGRDAINYLSTLQIEEKHPDLIITDINMPEMNGITFIKELRKLKSFRFIPILVLTTESEEQMKNEGQKAGAAGWLVKPVKPLQLLEAVKKILS